MALTGLGLCLSIISVVIAFANLLGMGGEPLCSIERGRGNEKEAEVIMGNSFVLLVAFGLGLTVLVPIFIFVLDMGVRGAALATILSQFLSALWIVKFLTGKKTILRLKTSGYGLRKHRVKDISKEGGVFFHFPQGCDGDSSDSHPSRRDGKRDGRSFYGGACFQSHGRRSLLFDHAGYSMAGA